jgi:hypothetical protein
MQISNIDNLPFVDVILWSNCDLKTNLRNIQNIAKIFPTMKELICAINKQNTMDEKINILMSVEKIGKEKAKSILKFLSLE